MKIILISILSFFFTIYSYTQWQPNLRLTTDPSDSYLSYNNAHCIAVDGEAVHVVWWDIRDSDREIYYKRSTDNGLTWQQDTRLINSSGQSEYPSIGASGSIVHIVWMDDRDESFYPEIYYKNSMDGGLSWSTDERLTFNPSDPGLPSLAANGSDVHIVWYDIRDGNWEIYYKRSIDNGLTWQPDLRLTNNSAVSERPSIVTTGNFPNEQIYVSWQDERDNDKEVYFKKSTDGGITWSDDTRLTDNVGESENVSISADNNFICISWSDNRNGIGNGEIYCKYSTDSGNNWSNDIRLTINPSNSFNPSIKVSSNLIHICYNNYYDIFYLRSTNYGSTWETEVPISNNNSDSQYAFVAASDSTVHIIWQDRMAGNEDIYYKQNPTGNIITDVVCISNNIPKEFNLNQNFPNPFNPSTTISFHLPTACNVELKIYDIIGNEITTLVDEYKSAGIYNVGLRTDHVKLSSGIYFYKLIAGNFNQTKKMILIR